MKKVNVPLILFLILIVISIVIFISHPLISCIMLFGGSIYYRKKNNKYGQVYEEDYFTNIEKYKFDNTILGYITSAILAVILSFTTIFIQGSVFVLFAWIIYLFYMVSCILDCIKNKNSNKTQAKVIKEGGFSNYKEYEEDCKMKNKQENIRKIENEIKESSKFYESSRHCYIMSTDDKNIQIFLRLDGYQTAIIRKYNISSKICYAPVVKEGKEIRAEIEKLQARMEEHYGLNNQWKEKNDPEGLSYSYSK